MIDNLFRFNVIQFVQAVSHMALATVAAVTIPDRYWFGFMEEDLALTTHQPIGVQVLYLSALCYHLYMYFQDPVCGTKIRPHHLVTISTVTVLAFCHYFHVSVAIIIINYMLDIWNFIFTQFKTIDNAKIASVCITKIHHVLTVLLIAISWVYGRATIGCIVMFVNDVTGCTDVHGSHRKTAQHIDVSHVDTG